MRETDAAGRSFRTAPFQQAPALCAEGAPLPEWIDYNNHMNIGYYLIAIDLATDQFFEEWLGIGPSMAEEEGCGSFVIQSHMHFLREVRSGEQYRVVVQMLDYDAKRWHYIATLEKAADGVRAATAEQIAMCVDHVSRRSRPLPESRLARLSEMMAAHRDLPTPPEVAAPLGIRRRAAPGGADAG